MAPYPSSLFTTIGITAYQDSTPSFSKGTVAYPTGLTYINTNASTFLYSSSSDNIVIPANAQCNFIANIATYTPIYGFSFQYFGGYSYQPTTFVSVTLYVYVSNAQNSMIKSCQITYSLLRSDLIDGSMIFIPFNPNVLDSVPTYVQNLVFTPSVGIIDADKGQQVRISFTSSGPMKGFQNENGYFYLAGSLVTANAPNPITYGTNFSGSYNANTTAYVVNSLPIGNFIYPSNSQNGFMLIYFYMSYISFNTIPSQSYPQTVTFTFSAVNTSAINLYTTIITVLFDNESFSTFPIRLPFNNPAPGDDRYLLLGNSGKITSINTTYNPNVISGVNYYNGNTYSYPVLNSITTTYGGSSTFNTNISVNIKANSSWGVSGSVGFGYLNMS